MTTQRRRQVDQRLYESNWVRTFTVCGHTKVTVLDRFRTFGHQNEIVWVQCITCKDTLARCTHGMCEGEACPGSGAR